MAEMRKEAGKKRETAEVVVEVKNLEVEYATGERIRVPKFTAKKGEMVSILGPNGGGKTTFIKALLGLIPYRGKVKLFGKEPEKLANKSKLIGYLPQFSYQRAYFPITVEEVISMPGLKRDFSKELGLERLKHKLFSELSGGQRQRILIARALANDPKIIILDEPESNLDAKWRDKVIKILKRLAKEGKTIIYITHDLGITLKLVDKIACINRDVFLHETPDKAIPKLSEVYGCEFAPLLHTHGVEHVVVKEHD